MTQLLELEPAEPVLSAEHVPPPATCVFNPGVCRWDGGLLLAYRNDHGRWGDPHFDGTVIGLARSDDLGRTWRIIRDRALTGDDAVRLVDALEPHGRAEREVWRLYDPRLTVIDGALLLSLAVDTTHGLRAALLRSDDALIWEPLALGPPDNRNQVLFPERLGGRYHRLERPMNAYGGEALGAERYGLWTAASPDLRHWGDHRFLADERWFPFANDKIGPGAPPVRVAEGWLCLIHTVDTDPRRGARGWEASWTKRYDAAFVLLDGDDPSRVLAVSPEPARRAEASWECRGFRDDVVFPGGLIVDGDDVVAFHGAADTVVGRTRAALADVMGSLVEPPER